MRAHVVAGLHLRTLAASPHLLASSVLLAGALMVVLGLVLHDLPDPALAATGILWPVVVFTAVHGTVHGLAQDAQGGGLVGSLLLPVERSTLVLGRITSNAVATGGLALIVLVVLRFILPPSTGLMSAAMVAVVLLASVGLAAVTTLAAHAAVATTARDLVGAVLAIPLAMPVLIGAVHGSLDALSGGWTAAGPNITFLVGYDILLLGAAVLLADAVVEAP